MEDFIPHSSVSKIDPTSTTNSEIASTPQLSIAEQLKIL